MVLSWRDHLGKEEVAGNLLSSRFSGSPGPQMTCTKWGTLTS